MNKEKLAEIAMLPVVILLMFAPWLVGFCTLLHLFGWWAFFPMAALVALGVWAVNALPNKIVRDWEEEE